MGRPTRTDITLDGWDYMSWVSVRVEFNSDGSTMSMSCGADISWDDNLFNEKLALLKLISKGEKVEGIGRRWGRDVYYLRFYTGEYVIDLETEDEV